MEAYDINKGWNWKAIYGLEALMGIFISTWKRLLGNSTVHEYVHGANDLLGKRPCKWQVFIAKSPALPHVILKRIFDIFLKLQAVPNHLTLQ